MPAANVRRRGMGSPERPANRPGTQVDNQHSRCATWDTQVENLCYEGHRYGSTSVAVPWRMTRPAASSTTQVAARFAKPWSCVTTTMV